MLINGREVEVDFKRAEEIQSRVNTVEQLPDNTKSELTKKELKELNNFVDSFGSLDGYGMSNNTLLTGKNAKENRKDYYTTFQEMSECNFIHRGLQIIADDCSQRNQLGHVIKINSDDDEIKNILEDLFNDRLNIDKELWSIFYETCKLGDNFYEVIPDSYQNPKMIARIRYLEPERVNRIEKNGKLAFYTYTADLADPEEIAFKSPTSEKDEEKVIYKLEPWQIIHFRITDKDYYPYGGSLLKSGIRTFRRLQLLEDGMVVYRLARVPERRVFKIDCGNLPQSEANKYVNRIKDNYRTSQILDDKGNINRTASALSLNQDIFIPMREGSQGTDISTLAPGQALNNIDDIRYFRDQILWTMNIPPEYLGFTSDQSGGSQGRGSLAMQDIKFSRFAERIQFHIEEGLTKLAAIELFFNKKKKSDLKNFKIELTPPSNIKELMNIEYLNQKMTLIQAMNGTGLFPKKFILEYVMQMTKKEINDLTFFKDLEMQAGQNQENAMLGGMGMPVGGAEQQQIDDGGVPTNQAMPSASINTETFEEKVIRLFGKDVLIENKEDWVKIVQAMNDYNSKSNNITEEEIDLSSSNILEEMKKVFNNTTEEKTNKEAISLLYENELGGLNFSEGNFCIFEAPKKKRGPKSKNNLIYEEKKIQY